MRASTFYRLAAAFAALILLASCSSGEPAGGGPTIPPPPTVEPGAPPPPLKIYIAEPGLYELPVRDLAPYGLADDPGALRLTHQGRPQPVWLAGDGPDQALRFYGQASTSIYSAESVYFLQAGDAPAYWMEEIPAPAAPPGGEASEQALATLHLEGNERYSPQVETGDHFFWRILAAPGASPFDFTLTGLAEGPGQLRVEVWASTEAPQDPDHRMRLALNGQPLADLSWDGIGRQTLEAAIPAGVLVAGENQVVLEAPGDIGVVAEVAFVDWLEIDFPRRLAGGAGQLAFAGADQPMRLSGFREPVTVFDVTDPEAVTHRLYPGGDDILLPAAPGRDFVAVGGDEYLRPVQVAQAWTAPDLRAAGSGADYLAIGPAELLAPLAPLLEWRAGQGLATLALPLEAVFDQFGHGYPEPAAVQALMAYAAESWDPAPRYLLLVGDASYDPRGYLTPPEANRLPTFLVQTVHGGETASDLPFGELDDDPWPEIAVGRLPARTAGQVAVIVEKILAYEAQLGSGGDWQKRVLAVADGQSAQFRQDAQTFLDQFSGSYDTELFAPEAGVEGAGAQVRAQIEAGAALVAYFGHGSVTQWGKDDLFTVEDIAGLGNGDRLPVVVNMTCLTGLFTHPEVDSLAETLLWEPGGGAVAVLAPTSLTLPWDQGFLSAALVAALEDDPEARLGDIMAAARRAVSPDTDGGRDVLLTFLLFGDPGLRLVEDGE